MDKNSDVFNKSIFETDGKQNKKHFFAVRSMVVCFLALIIQMFCFIPVLAVNEIKCCVGETISIRSSENETPRFDSDYLIRNKDKTFTAIKDGTTKVTFTSQAENTDNQGTGASKERTVTVKISKQVKNISLNKAEIALGAGETLKLKHTLTKGTWCQSVKFISSKKNVVSVDKNGKLTAKKAGTAVITAKTSNGLSAVCVVTVKNAPKTVNSWYIKQPNGKAKYFEYPKGTHVTVLTGFSDSTVYMVDPIDGVVSYNINTFKDRWNLLGRQAIVLNRK